MATCARCDTELPDNARFCLACGAEVVEQSEPEVASELPQAVAAPSPRSGSRAFAWFLGFLVLVGGATAAGLLLTAESRAVAKAQELIEVGSYAEALDLLSEQVKQHPRNKLAYYWTGVAHTKNDGMKDAKGAFDRCCNLDGGSKQKVGVFLKDEALRLWKAQAKGEDTAPGDPAERLNLAAKYWPRIDEDEEVFYRLHVQAGYAGEDKLLEFVNKFPSSARCPEVLHQVATSRYNSENFTGAKGAFARVAQDYPETEEGRMAKERLQDWWCEIQRTIYCDKKVNSFVNARKGQEFQVSAYGDIRLYDGEIRHITPRDVKGFFGTLSEGRACWNRTEFFKERIGSPYVDIYSLDRERKERDTKAWEEQQQLASEGFVVGDRWRGKAPRSGRLWLRVDSDYGEQEGSFSVTIRYKP